MAEISNRKFLMFAGRLFHSLGAATDHDLAVDVNAGPLERSPLYKDTTSLSRASAVL